MKCRARRGIQIGQRARDPPRPSGGPALGIRDTLIVSPKLRIAEKTDLADRLRSAVEDTADVQRFSVRGLAGDHRIRGHFAVAAEFPGELALAQDLQLPQIYR